MKPKDISFSEQYFAQSLDLIPGGVNSPVRAFKAVGGNPIFIDSAEGCHLQDVDGNKYIDYVMSWGAMIVGHSHHYVIDKVAQTLAKGLSFGAPTKLELELAQELTNLVPNLQQVRMVNSGTEATMSALRLARAATGRKLIVKFEGCYHGHHDALLVKSGSGALTQGSPTSAGINQEVIAQTITLPYNDINASRECLQLYGKDVACIIVEPVAGNMGCVLPDINFLKALRDQCDIYGALLIFDEVMSGFRVDLGGAQARYGIDADIITLGKIIGGGMSVGAYGGKRDIMQLVSPQGNVYQAGTLAGNPIAMAAGLANIELVQQVGFYPQLETLTQMLVNGIKNAAERHHIDLVVNTSGSMFGLFFTDSVCVNSFDQVMTADVKRFTFFFWQMLQRGIYLAPSAFEAGFLSAAHTVLEVEATIHAADQAFAKMAQAGI